MKAWIFAVLLLSLPARGAEIQPAEITVLTAGAMAAVASAERPAFEKETGHSVVVRNDTVGGLVRRIRAGEPFDAVLMSPAGLDEIGDKIEPGSKVTLARVGVGVGVRTGTPAPDIGTVEAFKAAMLNARAVAYIDPASGGSNGIYLAKLFRQLGIEDAMAGKSVLVKGGLAGTAVADGRADVVVQQISEIMAVPSVTLVGPLPAAIQMETVYAGAVAAGSAHADAAKAFLTALSRPEMREVMTAKGLMPP